MGSGLVAVIGYRVEVGDDRTGAPRTAHAAVSEAYVKAVRRAGGRPVVVPVADAAEAEAVVDEFPAVVITGGTDVDPERYGAARDERTLEPDHHRDVVEIAVVRAAVSCGTPLLAICRGVQVLNVALGGTLHQHLDDHMRMDRYNQDVHRVRVVGGSALAALVGSDLGTNSLHHQAIDRVAPGSRAVAWAPDGTVEAIEVAAAPRTLGVQWHPELLRHRPEHLALFRTLVG